MKKTLSTFDQGVGLVADPLIKTPFNLKKRAVKGVHGGDHAELLTPCLWRLVVMGYGPGESAIRSKDTS